MNTQTLFWQMVVFLTLPAMLTSFLLCRLMRSLAPKLNYVDRPLGRKNHTKIMPYGGGIGIFLALTLFLLANHGAVTWGTTLEDAYFKMESAESYCQILVISMQIGGPVALSAEELNSFLG